MDEETTAQLRGLLNSVSESGSASFSLIQSQRLRRSLRSTRIWAGVLLALGIIIAVLLIVAMVFALFDNSERRPPFQWVGPLIFTSALLVPLSFLGIYVGRLHSFLKNEASEQFLRLVIAQRWLWTVLGIYAGFVIVIVVVMLAITLGTLLFFAMSPGVQVNV